MNCVVVAVHGNGGGGFRFSLLRPTFDLRAPTLPGFEGGEPLDSLFDYACWLKTYLQDCPRPRVLLGTGIGGSLALELIRHFPTEVDGVILHAPVGAALEKRLFPRFMKIPGVARAARFLLSWPPLIPLWTRLLFRHPQRIPAGVLQRFFSAYRNCPAFFPMFEWINAAWWAELPSSSLPAALLWGERERVLKVEQIGAFLEKLPEATVRVVPNWDHFPMLEQPEEFCHEIELLLREVLA